MFVRKTKRNVKEPKEIPEKDIQILNNFVKTKGAISRVNTVVNGIKSGIPLLLEGETGTSKTVTAKQAADEINQKAIVFSFSSQTSVEDLLGRITKDNKSWSGFSFIKGPYTKAFENGYCIILDEINLAHEDILQCIEASIDSQKLSLDFSGSEVDKIIQMHPDFHLIATQNPLTNRFSQKRNFLSHKFTSRFQKIKFKEIEHDELLEIALGLSKNIPKIDRSLVESLVEFHFKWQENKFSKTQSKNSSSSYVFTIREISRTINSIKKGLTPFESILINYGARYDDESKNEIKKLLKKLGINEDGNYFIDNRYVNSIKEKYSSNTNIPEIIITEKKSKFYFTKTLEKVLATSFHLLDNFQSILIVGPDGCGKTSIGRWIGELYNLFSGIKNKSDYKFLICNPEMMISDIVGRYILYKQKNEAHKEEIINEAQIEWKYGPVVEAMKNGDCLILDQIDTAPATILERLNSLFDGLSQSNFKFTIQENLEDPEVYIDQNFRIIATSSLDGMNNLSPAFLNRFTIIYVNEQLDYIGSKFGKFIRCLSPYASSTKGSNYMQMIESLIRKKLKEESFKLTSLNLSRCVNGFFKLKEKFLEAINQEDCESSDEESILNFCLQTCILHSNTIPDMNDSFIDAMLSYLEDDKENNTQFDTFHFKEAKSTRKVMATLAACSIIGLHTILIGRTGIGKTAAAMAFARTFKPLMKKDSTHHIISFNGETQLEDLYGYFTIENGNFTEHQGELSQAMSDGQIFIADELNLAEPQIIQSLNVSIDPSSGENIILPVTGSLITIKEGFFFIGCQNDLTMKGRKQLPESIKKKVLCINYPEPSQNDITNICISIAKPFGLDNAIPKFTATLIKKINSDSSLKSWSLREVRILFRRISYFQGKTQETKGLTPVHHIAFMMMSTCKKQPEMIDKIANYVCSCFSQDEKELIKDLTTDIKVYKYINDKSVSQSYIDSLKPNSDNVYLIRMIKGSLELKISNKQLFFIPDNIKQLWETIFEICLTNQSEPLLFNGPSGFKTYLAGLISSLSPVIYLHSDSTVSSLIGQITLLDRHQAKINLLESLNDFAGSSLSLKKEINDIKADVKNFDEFDEKTLNSIVDRIINRLPKSFVPIVQNVVNRLISIQNEKLNNNNSSMFSNFISLFRPGLITRSIFSQNSLILKNFAQPLPSVIERFNELLSVTPTLTLFEDTANTYTSDISNKLYGFSNFFRIIGICLPYEKRNLSDAMLSRLTEIQIPEYSIEEQESVFMTYLRNQENKEKPLGILRAALALFEKEKLNISFRQKIKIIEVANQWQKKYPKMNLSTIYSISILRCAGGPLSSGMKQKLFNSMKNQTKVFDLPLNLSQVYQSTEPDSYKPSMQNSCLSLNKEGDTITSSLTYFTHPYISNSLLKEKPNLVFTHSINDLIDVIFTFSIINYPLIIEGPNGCGKSSALFYVTQCLGIKVIQISLSQSTTIEDLFGRYEPSSEGDSIRFEYKPTALLMAIDADQKNDEEHWILIENLHLASPSVIDALEPIFNPRSDHVAKPDGSFIKKGDFFIVGLLTKPLQKQSITNTALYYKMRNYTKNEFSEICQFILENNGLHDSVKHICPILSRLYEISSSSQIKVPVTPREAYKFVKMVKGSLNHSNHENKLNYIQICQILSIGRFYDNDMKLGVIQDINKALNNRSLSDVEEIPDFSIENGITLSTNRLSINSSISIRKYNNEINHLTQSEKQLFEFLILNIDEYSPIIVQGPTASGKTFSIQLFANILGKNLKILQMNQEINSSFIAGSFHPSKKISSNEINELHNALELLVNIVEDLPEKFESKMKKIIIDQWSLSDFIELKKAVEKLIKSSLIDDEELNNAAEFVNKVNSTLLFVKHIEINDSIIINALKNGDWLLLDGIESATADFLDRLSTLLDDPPTLNLFERGNDYTFSMNSKDNDKFQSIHPNFRLFLTYNPVNSYSNNVSSSFLSKCTLYSMQPIDSNINDSAILVSNIIDKSVFSFLNQSEISARIANVHMKMKNEKQMQLTCRTLIHISREIFYRNQDHKLNKEQLMEIISNHYSYDSVEPIFNEKVDYNLVNQLESIEMGIIKIRNIMIDDVKRLYEQIANIVKNKPNIKLIFNYNEFLTNMQILQFKYYNSINQELIKIKNFIKDHVKQFSKDQISFLASFNTLSQLFSQITLILYNKKVDFSKYQDQSLSSAIVSQNTIFELVVFQFKSFQFLCENNYYLERIPDVFIDNDFSKSYFELFHKKEKGSLPADAFESLNKSPYSDLLNLNIRNLEICKYDTNTKAIQQICSTFFKFENCCYLFSGIMRDLYLFSFSIFSLNDLTVFIEWIKWLDKFFNTFEPLVASFNIPFSIFKQKLIDIKDQDMIINIYNQVGVLKQKPKEIKSNENGFIEELFKYIEQLHTDFHNSIIENSKNKKSADLFLQIKDKIEELQNKVEFRIPIRYYNKYICSLNLNQISKNIDFYFQIFNSISQYAKSIQKEEKISWPTNDNFEVIEQKRSIFLESLISYSSEMKKLNDIEFDKPQWSLICELSEPDTLLQEYVNKSKISKESIDNYKSFLNARLLDNIFESNNKDPNYCNKDKIISFFNNMIDQDFEPSWLKIAENVSNKYSADFLISIPTFSEMDIVSLLVNPLTRKHGCIFKENEIPTKLINDFYSIFELIQNPINKSFKFVNEKIIQIFTVYLNSNYSDLDIQIDDEEFNFAELIEKIKENTSLKGIHNLCQKVLDVTVLCEVQEVKSPSNLNFTDVQNINFDDFNSFIDNHPFSGLYIAQFPEVRDNLKIIQKLCTITNIRKNNFPLALFVYRIYSQKNIIKFQFPTEFPLEFCEEFQSCISTILNSKNKSIIKFSNLVGFLLLNPPNFIKEIKYSSYVRSIIINLMTTKNDKSLLNEIMKVLKDFLPKLIETIGSDNWNSVINQELKYDKNNEIISFLSNPWNYILQHIYEDFDKDFKSKNNEVKNSVNSIIKMISDFKSDKSSKQLRECVENDEKDFQDKRIQQYIDNERKNEEKSEDLKSLIKYWNAYSKYTKCFVDSIQDLPTSSQKFEYKSHFSCEEIEKFYNFFANERSYLSCKNKEIMVIWPESDTITIQFTKNRKPISSSVTIENRIALFLKDKNTDYTITGGNVKIISIYYDQHVLNYQSTSMDKIISCYNEFNKYYKKVDKEDLSKYNYDDIIKKIGEAKLFFGTINIDDFEIILNKIFEKFKSFNEDYFYDKSYILDDLQNEMKALEQYTNIGFLDEIIEIPHRTKEFISDKLILLISSSKKNLNKSNFDLFSDDYRNRYEFINNKDSLFQILLKKSSQFNMKLEPNRIQNIKMDNIEASDSLLVPSIFKNGDAINITIKQINISIENLLFDVDVTPLQIRLCNYTNEDIICEFDQKGEDIPNYRNEKGYVIIEIPIKSFSKKVADNIKQNDNFETTFQFDGTLSLHTDENPSSTSKIKYSISLHYISLTAFIQIENNHKFAIKDGKAKIVPFIAGPKTQINFQKFTNREIQKTNLINYAYELRDNKALKPDIKSLIEPEDPRICSIKSSFAESNPNNSYLSMNYRFGFSKDNIIPVEIKIDTFPQNNKLYLAIYSDKDKDFKEQNGIITIGNLSRKIYFFIGYLNISNDPILPTNVELFSDNYHVQAIYDESNIKEKIEPNKYGEIIPFFEARYFGPYEEKPKNINAHLKVSFGNISKTVDFMYQICNFKIEGSIFTNKTQCNVSYFDGKNFIESNKLDKAFWHMENRIIVGPYGYICNCTNNSNPCVDYNPKKGSFIGYTNKSKKILEILEFTSENKFRIIEKADKSFALSNDIYLFARLKDKPETYFPLFCPNNKIDKYFDARKCTKSDFDYKFSTFYFELFTNDEKKRIYGSFDSMFTKEPSSLNNFSKFINAIGKKYDKIKFNKLLFKIKEFTNYSKFQDHYYQALHNLAGDQKEMQKDQKYQFVSYISALNEIAFQRFEELQANFFYLSPPIEFVKIEKQQQKMLSEEVKETNMVKCKYVIKIQNMTKQENELEEKCAKQLEKDGYSLTSVLKWNQKQGLIPSSVTEYNKYLNSKITLKCNIESIPNRCSFSDSSSNSIELLNLQNKTTLKTLFNTFDKILSSTNTLPFSIYSIRQNHNSLEEAKMQLNQLLTIYNWEKKSEECFPFSSFRASFEPSFDAMITRLINAKLEISDFEYINKNIENYVKKPSSIPINMVITTFKQPGNQIIINNSMSKVINDESNIEKEIKIQEEKKKEVTKKIIESDSKVPTKNFIYTENKTFVAGEKAIPTIKNVVFEEISANTKEIPDTDFIQYLIQEMLQKDINDTISYQKSSNSHIPKAIQKINNIGIGNQRINSFIEASTKLSDILINEVSKADNFENLLNNKDTIYSSILVDCTSTLSNSQKAAQVTLVMALGNALTSIKIPYSIILFCESNFQFILKQVDESHDLIHFEKLLDTITVRRRMSDMSSAILMADDEIKSKDKNRKNHSMFVLTDGLTTKIKLINQWKDKVLNNPKRSIMFYFLDILSTEHDRSLVYPIWNDFKENIKNSKSINNVIFSKASSIYNGDAIFVEPFIEILSNFIGEYEPDKQIILPELAPPISKIEKEFLDNILDNISKGIVDVQNFYAQSSFSNDILSKFTRTDLNLSQPNPLVSFLAGIEGIKPDLINTFFIELAKYSNSLFDSSILQEITTLVFPPNKPSQYTPSENGNIFYFPGLMKFILTQGQDSKIFLEKKAGFIQSYSVFVVIDNSTSCFNALTYAHAFQTILALLLPLSKIDIPSLNIIITTANGPLILCSEKPSMMALDVNSPLWISLFSNLSRPHSIHSNFYTAMMSAYQMRIQQKSLSSILFVLTDGCYGFAERNELNGIFDVLKTMNMIPITIGIGMNPKSINLLTDKAVWSENAKNIWRAILFLFDKEGQVSNEIKTCFSVSQFTNEKAQNLESNLLTSKVFPSLFDELNKVVRKVATYRNYYNKDQMGKSKSLSTMNSIEETVDGKKKSLVNSSSGEFVVKNAPGAEFDLGKKGYYKGVKLLIVMCWDCTCSDVEDKRLTEKVLRDGIDDSRISVVNALIYFGIETNIVKNYKEAINEMTKGIYSQVWIICGRMDGSMPSNRNPETNDSSLIDQFIDCVIMFWSKGGGLVFWTDNYPLTAEVNKFLEKATFKVKNDSNKYCNTKVNFHIGGDYPGKQMMMRNQNKEIYSLANCTFESNDASMSEGYEKELFNHGLFQIYEGYTIASAISGSEQPNEWKNYRNMNLNFASDRDILPFRAFSKSSSGGFSSLYYMSPLDSEDGDIVIDCGFSKLFFELTEEGIDRYVKNIAVWMLQLEKKDIKYGSTKDARLVVPPRFIFKLNTPSPLDFHKFESKQNVDLVFLVDGTGSMRYFIEAVRDCCNDIAKQCHKKFPGRGFRFGAVVYRDTIVTTKNPFYNDDITRRDKKKDIVELSPLDEDPKVIRRFFAEREAYGGGKDGPEDWVSGYETLLHKIKWNKSSIKIVIHICDAAGHGTSFTCDPKYAKLFYRIPYFSDKRNELEDDIAYQEIQDQQDEEFRFLIKEAAEKGLIFFCLNNHKKSMYCFKQTKMLYDMYNGKKFVIQNQFNNFTYDGDENYDDDDDTFVDENAKLLQQLIDQVKQIVMSAVDVSVAVSQRQYVSDYEKDCMMKFECDYNKFDNELKNKYENMKKYEKFEKGNRYDNHIRSVVCGKYKHEKGWRGRGSGK